MSGKATQNHGNTPVGARFRRDTTAHATVTTTPKATINNHATSSSLSGTRHPRGERAVAREGTFREAFPDEPMRFGVGVEPVRQRQRPVVCLPLELGSVEAVQVRVVPDALRDDAGKIVTDRRERQLPGCALGRISRRDERQRPGGRASVSKASPRSPATRTFTAST
ncbi:hypothetical protein ACFWDA_06385 [Rhodococcus zopfii]|uniref:hypothetical protein n=2 Tax=Rhodococcus zopfii TaxID=43772 RepID=UPI0036511EEA